MKTPPAILTLGFMIRLRILGCGLALLAASTPGKGQDADGDGLPDAWETGYGRYEIVRGVFTWDQAQTHAQARGGHLATVINAIEWADLKTVLGAELLGKNLWLGGTDAGSEGNWRWITGEKWAFTNWRPGQPDNDSLGNGLGTPENYLMIWGREVPASETALARWNDVTITGGLLARDGYVFERGAWTDPTRPDTDLDGLSDALENPANPPYQSTTDPNNPDSDQDQLLDGEELNVYHTNPTKADTDDDGISDSAELRTHRTNPLSADTDGDGLADGRELFILQTDPLNADTDGDTFGDGEEIAAGTNPRDPKSSLVAPHRQRTAVELEFQPKAGFTYQVQRLNSAGSWEPVGEPIAGNDNAVRKLISIKGSSKGMWRVILAK